MDGPEAAGRRVAAMFAKPASVDSATFADAWADFEAETRAKHEAIERDRRRVRRKLRDVAARCLPNEAVCRCGRHASRAHGGGEHVAIKRAEGRAFFSGVVTCGSVWHCPVCASKVSEARREEIEAVVGAHEATGGVVYHAVMTVPHHAFQACKPLRQAVTKAWQEVQRGKAWMRLKERYGFVGNIRSLEVTHGGNGWHPHIHVLMFFDHGDWLALTDEFGAELFARWQAAVERLGMGKPSRRAFRWERCWTPKEAGEYVAKWGLEMTKGHMKTGKRSGQRTPWQILQDIAETGSEADKALFREYGQAFKGARQLTWSRGLRALYLVDDEMTDAEAAQAEPVESETVATVAADGYKILVSRELEIALLEHVERDGADGVFKFCWTYDVPLNWFRLAERNDHAQGRHPPPT